MDDAQIADLKQFIAVTVSQQIVGVREDMSRLGQKFNVLDRKIDNVELRLHRRIDSLDRSLHQKIDALDRRVNKKIDDLSAAVGEALDTNNEEIDKQLKDHERRLVRLEKRTA